jgi:hypothetical protein
MIDKGIRYEDQKLTKKQKKKIKPANQGGGPNYLGKQKTVTVPKKWLSDPDHVVAELAYITPREKKILIDLDLYGSLKGKPNRGPAGIQSLQGDMGSVGGGGGGGGGGGNNDGPSARDKAMGMQGKTGKADPSIGDGGVDDRGTPEQNANQRAQVREAQVRAVENLIDRPKIGFTDAATYNLLSPKNILSGLGSLITGVPFVGPLISELGTKFNDKYGPFNNREFYEEKVKPAGKTDLSYEDYMEARMKGDIDAYGNPTGSTDRGGGNETSGILQNLLSNSNLFSQPTITPVPSQRLNYAYTPDRRIVIAPGTALGRRKVTI